MDATTVLVGSPIALANVVRGAYDGVTIAGADVNVVVVPTAGAFRGLAEVATTVSLVFDGSGARVEALMLARRSDGADTYFVQRLLAADVVVLAQGSALHALSVWRGTPVGEAIRDASRLVAVGSVATVLGEVMIDPRGGAPTLGLGYRNGLVVTTPTSEEQLARTRSLLGDDHTLAVLGPGGVVVHDAQRWRSVADDVVVTRGSAVVAL